MSKIKSNDIEIKKLYDEQSDVLFVSQPAGEYKESRELEDGFFADFNGVIYTGFTFFDFKKRISEGFTFQNALAKKLFKRLMKEYLQQSNSKGI